MALFIHYLLDERFVQEHRYRAGDGFQSGRLSVDKVIVLRGVIFSRDDGVCFEKRQVSIVLFRLDNENRMNSQAPTE